jgi:thiol-disulfide isomerase/thioredoxin
VNKEREFVRLARVAPANRPEWSEAMMRQLLAASLIFVLAGAARADETLGVGDPAPKLEVKEFVKGDPVKKLEKGKIYVVEFWATWCAPCKESIPHLTKLQKEFKDVVFIGVSVAEKDFDDVKPFVKEMGDKMDYRVAIDSVAEGGAAGEGAMNTNWLTAADQEGIPTAFVVDKDGKIAWIGHPGRLDKPLKLIVAGKWDAKAEIARAKKVEEAHEKIKDLIQDENWKAAIAAVDSAIKSDPKLEAALGPNKFQLLWQAGDVDKAAAYGRKLTDEIFADDAEGLNELAWLVVDPEVVDKKKPDAKLVKVALAAAIKAVELTKHQDTSLLDTLANAHFANGEVDKAIEIQEKAIKMKPDDDELREHLVTFKRAKEDK